MPQLLRRPRHTAPWFALATVPPPTQVERYLATVIARNPTWDFTAVQLTEDTKLVAPLCCECGFTWERPVADWLQAVECDCPEPKQAISEAAIARRMRLHAQEREAETEAANIKAVQQVEARDAKRRNQSSQAPSRHVLTDGEVRDRIRAHWLAHMTIPTALSEILPGHWYQAYNGQFARLLAEARRERGFDLLDDRESRRVSATRQTLLNARFARSLRHDRPWRPFEHVATEILSEFGVHESWYR